MKLDPLDEAVRRLAAAPRDPAAWQGLFTLTWPYVWSLAHAHLSGGSRAADADDLAQEVFLRLSRAWHAGQVEAADGAALRALLAVTTRRLTADWFRREHRQRRDVSKQEPAGAAEPAAPPAEAAVDWADLLGTVSRRLTPIERRVLELRLQGYEVAEVAARLGVTTRTVERKLARVRELLRPHLDIAG